MKKYQPVLSFLFCLFLINTSLAQKTTNQSNIAKQDYDVKVTYAEFLGKTPPLRNLVPMAPNTSERRAQHKKRRKTVNNFVGRGRYQSTNPNALPQGADPIWQSNNAVNRSVIPNEPLVTIEGMDIGDSGGIAVPDQSMDVGNNYVIQMVNVTLLQIFDKQGNEVTQPIAANTIWSQIGFSSAGDPIVMYDQEADRWIITEFPSGNQLLFAISETSDPMGSWMAWNFATPQFPDYPKYSIWPNAYCVTTNEQGPSTLPNYFIDREAILNGDATVAIQRITIPGIGTGPGFQVSTPVDWTGSNLPVDTNPMILSLNDDAWGATTQDQIDMHSINLDWDNPANSSVSTQSIVTAPFDTNPCSTGGFGFACIPQLNGDGIDGLPEVIMHQVHYRNFSSHESIVLNFITDATGNDLAGIRWMELRRTPGNDWEVYQEGTFAPDDGLHRFMGSICMDGAGNIGLAYNVSSPDTYAGIRYTGRRASDPLGEMTIDEYTVVEGESALSTNTRFGDYNHMSIDPANDRTFWFTGEYAAENGGWGTRILAFELRRDTTDLGPTALVTPQSSPDLSANETVTIEIKNFGLDTQSVYDIGYIFEGNAAVIETANFTLFPDSTYTHTFVPQVDMSAIGDYNFKIFTSLPTDNAPLNDTLNVVVSKLPMYDAGISDILGLETGLCGTDAPATLVLTNFGTETLTSVNIDMMLNMTALPQINWTGALMPGASEIININLENLADGMNTVNAVTSLPNNQVDQIPVNDSSTKSFNNIVDGVTITLNISTDDFPDETTWSLFDPNGVEIVTGGPYQDDFTLYQEAFCLDPDLCYTFTIFDSFGDGICCNEGDGNYFIEDEDGNILVGSTGEFGDDETSEFCATFACSISADVSYTPESAAGTTDAAILIEVQSGSGTYVYSIDGGATFQNENIFDNLPAGTYEIYVADGNSCIYEETITIVVCALEVMAEVTNETGENISDGTILTTASNGTPPYQYSIDNGVTFQDSPDFNDLTSDDYTLTVRDANGCTSSIVATIDVVVSNSELTFGYAIEVFPNPTEGVSIINIKGLTQASVFLKFDVFDVNGKLVQASLLTRYDDTYTGQLSLIEYPSGTYFIRFANKDIKRMLKLIKQ